MIPHFIQVEKTDGTAIWINSMHIESLHVKMKDAYANVESEPYCAILMRSGLQHNVEGTSESILKAMRDLRFEKDEPGRQTLKGAPKDDNALQERISRLTTKRYPDAREALSELCEILDLLSASVVDIDLKQSGVTELSLTVGYSFDPNELSAPNISTDGGI